MELYMNKIWFTVLYILWGFLYSMNIHSAQTMALKGDIHPLAQLISLGLTVGIFGILLWALLHFRYKNAGVDITRTDKIWIGLSAIFMFLSLVVFYRGLKATKEKELQETSI